MKQTVAPGKQIDALTPDEFVRLVPRPEQYTVVREPANVALDASGGTPVTGVDIYKVPAGMEFVLRRITIDLGVDPFTGNVVLNAAGKWVQYLRSGTRIEWGQPAYGGVVQVPGVQTWGDQQGPYLRNGEVFGLAAKGLTASGILVVQIQGILRRPATEAQ